MKDRIRYSEAFKLKVMEEFRDGKWKSVKETATAYGLAEMSVYNWMHKLCFEHLKGMLIYVKTKSEIDEIKRLREENRQLKLQLADRVLDHEIDKATLKIACERLGMPVDELKKERFRVAHEVDAVVKRSKRKISERCVRVPDRTDWQELQRGRWRVDFRWADPRPEIFQTPFTNCW